MTNYRADVLFRTPTVDLFLNSSNMLGIEAPKGLGKTYLLKSKRMISQSEGVLCLPQDSLCDIMDKVTFEESMSRYLEDYVNWIDLWKAAICISIHKAVFKNDMTLRDQFQTKDDELYQSIYTNPYLVTTCQIMNFLINSERSLVRTMQTRIPLYIAVLSSINQPIHIFIDKTDQALRDNLHFIGGSSKMSRGPSNRSFWSFGQLSLAEASYQIYINNSHIKVYYGIRSEALVGAEDYTDIFLQLRSYIVKLQYSFYEAKQMFEHYISLEEDKWLMFPSERTSNPAKAFIGTSEIEHGYVKDQNSDYQKESLFMYLYRHTLKRPRDIMHICYRLCFSQLRNIDEEEKRIAEIRSVINRESRLLLQAYLREMGPFIFDNNDEGWHTFWTSIDSNAFSLEYVQSKCEFINATISKESISCNKKCDSCKHFKPFRDLYNVGLLGRIERNNVQQQESSIHFQATGEAFIQNNDDILPQSNLYLLHPMVTNKVEAARRDRNLDFSICREFIIGDGYSIDEYAINRTRAKEDDRLNKKRTKSVFLSSTCFDMEDCRKMVYRLLGSYDYYVVMSERNDFGMPLDDANSYDYCLDKVKTCSQLIYIIGKRFGGPYKGIRYKWLADEIRRMDYANKIGEPSISMMEYFLAKHEGIPTRVFTRKDLYNERSTYENNKSNTFKPFFVETTKVFEIISLITRRQTGNWFKTYLDLNDLLEILKIEFGNSVR